MLEQGGRLRLVIEGRRLPGYFFGCGQNRLLSFDIVGKEGPNLGLFLLCLRLCKSQRRVLVSLLITSIGLEGILEHLRLGRARLADDDAAIDVALA